MAGLWRFVRTCRHFPVPALAHRLRLRLLRRLYNPATLPEYPGEHTPTDMRALASFDAWAFEHLTEAEQGAQRKALRVGTGRLLNRNFDLPEDAAGMQALLGPGETALWREAVGYLDYLLPLLWQETLSKEDARVIAHQMTLFWTLPFATQRWSTYGVARRMLTYAACWPHLEAFPLESRERLIGHLYSDTRYLMTFLEWDLRGNHLIKNLKAWLAATLLLETVPAVSEKARAWRKRLPGLLARELEKQVLADGFHHERTPMYHLWVLSDLLDVIGWLKAHPQEVDAASLDRLTALARRMGEALMGVTHNDWRVAPFGDSSLPQTPDPALLLEYAQMVLGEEASPPRETVAPWQTLPDAGFAVLRLQQPSASLVVDFGDFGPRALPAHSHSDMGSFEVQVDGQALIVDGGISGYEAGPQRDYERSAAAHNTLWVPGEDQAELWDSFRIAEYPQTERPQIESDPHGIKVTLAYENHNLRYQHQRSLYGVGRDFWVIQDWVRHLNPTGRPCYSLLHIPSDVDIQAEQDIFTLADRMLVIPFGARQLNWTGQPDWEGNMNQVSAGFHLAANAQLLALSPNLSDCFGWILVPYPVGDKPLATRVSRVVTLDFGARGAYQMTWDSAGLDVAFRAPVA